MTNILIILILSSLYCFGIRALFFRGKLFEKAGIWMDEHFLLWVNQPLWRCPPCMASVHGIYIYLTFLGSTYGLFWLPAFLIMLCGLNYLALQIVNTDE